MYSVTQRIAKIKQPYGGYIRPRDMRVIELDDGINLYDKENIHATLIGIVVDYLSRFMFGTSVEKAFDISLIGASNVNELDYAQSLLRDVGGLDDQSIKNACQLAGYDVAYRAGIAAYKPVQNIHPDEATIFNIQTMVNRSQVFKEKYGPIVKDGFTFEGGYTNIISTGDGDFLTEKVLWDFKVLKRNPQSKDTLQLLIYYIMGSYSIHEAFQSIESLGIFNPRLNKVFLKEIKEIPEKVISEVAEEIIGYP